MQLKRIGIAVLLLLPPALLDAETPGPTVLGAPGEPGEPWRIALRLGYFQQFDGGGIPWLNEDARVFQAMALLDAPAGKRDRISVRVLTDIVTSASIRREQNDSFRALQSGASGVVHVDGRLGWSHAFDGWTLGAHASASWDYAYRSLGGGLSASIKLLDDNATLRFGASGFWDTLAMIRFNGEDQPNDNRWTASANVGWTHILTPLTVLDVSLSFTGQGGFLAGQFNSVLAGGSEAAEMLPSARNRFSLTARLKQGIGWRHAIEVGGRYYLDDWGIHAGTASAEYALWLDSTKRWLLRGGYRFHVQQAARAYATSFAAPLSLMTSDPDLGGFFGHSGTLGLLVKSPFGPRGGDLDIEGNFYHRTTGLDLFWFSLGWKIEI